jgi:hypothetical protein
LLQTFVLHIRILLEFTTLDQLKSSGNSLVHNFLILFLLFLLWIFLRF